MENVTLPKCKEYHPLSELRSKPGYYPNLSPAQIKMVHEVNMRISLESIDFFTDAEDHHLKILRFLRARKFDIEAAMEMIRNDAKWRHEEDRISLQRRKVEDCVKVNCPLSKVWHFYPTWIQGHDKQHRPVSYRKFCHFETWNLLKIASIQSIVDFHIWESEQAIRIMQESSEEIGHNVETFTVVIDATGFAFRMMTSEGFGFVKQIAGIDSDHYPERLGTLVVINAPMAVSVAWKVVSGFLDEATRLKIRIIGCDQKEWQSVLFDLIDKDQLPKAYGGTAPDLNFDEAMHGLNPDMEKIMQMEKSRAAAAAAAANTGNDGGTDTTEEEPSSFNTSMETTFTNNSSNTISNNSDEEEEKTGDLSPGVEQQIWSASRDDFVVAAGGNGGGVLHEQSGVFSENRSPFSNGTARTMSPEQRYDFDNNAGSSNGMPKHISLPSLLLPGVDVQTHSRGSSINSDLGAVEAAQQATNSQLARDALENRNNPAASSKSAKQQSTGLKYFVELMQCKAPICDGTMDDSQFDYVPITASTSNASTTTTASSSERSTPPLAGEERNKTTSTTSTSTTTSTTTSGTTGSAPPSGIVSSNAVRVPHSLLAPLPQGRGATPLAGFPAAARQSSAESPSPTSPSTVSPPLANRADGGLSFGDLEMRAAEAGSQAGGYKAIPTKVEGDRVSVSTTGRSAAKKKYQAPEALHEKHHQDNSAKCSACGCVIA